MDMVNGRTLLLATLLITTVLPVQGHPGEDPHHYLHIDGDADLAAQAASNGWPGTGTASDPFIIADIEGDMDVFEDDFRKVGARIVDTTSHVVLRNLHFYQSVYWQGGGIRLTGVSNLTIENATIEGLASGLQVDSGSHDLRVKDSVFDTGVWGVRAWNLRDSALVNNHIGGDGIVIFDSSTTGEGARRSTIHGNTAPSIDMDGEQHHVEGNEISGSLWIQGPDHTVAENQASFLYVDGAGATVSRNVVESLQVGATFGTAHAGVLVHQNEAPSMAFHLQDSSITNNTGTAMETRGTRLSITDNAVGAIKFTGSDSRLVGNTLSGADVGLWLYGTKNSVVRSNTVSADELAIDLLDSDENHIYDNLFTAPADYRVDSTSQANRWFVEPEDGVNILGGARVGGNAWSHYIGTDLNEDGFGDVPHSPAANPIGWVPEYCGVVIPSTMPCFGPYPIGVNPLPYGPTDLYPLV